MDEHCLACGGELVELGILGFLRWTRCRDCGMEQRHALPAQDPQALHDAIVAFAHEDDDERAD